MYICNRIIPAALSVMRRVNYDNLTCVGWTEGGRGRARVLPRENAENRNERLEERKRERE